MPRLLLLTLLNESLVLDSRILSADEPIAPGVDNWHYSSNIIKPPASTNFKEIARFLFEIKRIFLPLTKNLLGSEAALSKSSSLVIKLSRSSMTSVATSQEARDYNSKTSR